MKIKFGIAFTLLTFSLNSFGFLDRFVMTPNDDDFDKCDRAQKLGMETVTLNNIKGHKDPLRFYKRTHSRYKGNLIFYHGSGRSACENLEIYPYLENMPLNIFIVEYPGYGGDKRSPSEKRILPLALEMFDHVKRKNNLPIILYGSSMGTTISTYVASKKDIDGLILRNPPTSIVDVVDMSTWLPITFFLRSKFKAYKWAKKVKAPVRIFHGEEDDWIPVSMGKKQSQNFIKSRSLYFCSFPHQSLPKELWKGIPDFEDRERPGRSSQHMTMFYYPEYQKEVIHFINQVVERVERPSLFLSGANKGEKSPECL